MNLENYITAKQQREICGIIQTQCRRFQEMEREYEVSFVLSLLQSISDLYLYALTTSSFGLAYRGNCCT